MTSSQSKRDAKDSQESQRQLEEEIDREFARMEAQAEKNDTYCKIQAKKEADQQAKEKKMQEAYESTTRQIEERRKQGKSVVYKVWINKSVCPTVDVEYIMNNERMGKGTEPWYAYEDQGTRWLFKCNKDFGVWVGNEIYWWDGRVECTTNSED